VNARHAASHHRARWASIVLVPAALVVTLVACTGDQPKNDAQRSGQVATEEVYDAQRKLVPYPVDELKKYPTLENLNLAEKLKRELSTSANKVGYVYILNRGAAQPVMGYWTIRGKVSSNQSQMTTTNLVERHDGANNGGNLAYPAPGDDGTYGDWEPGIFFFTTEGAMVKTNSDYFYSDQPSSFGYNVPKLNHQ